MPISLEKVFALHENALYIRSARSELLAKNLANADTPHYKAKDINFKEAMAQAVNDMVPIKQTNAGHLGAAGGSSYEANLVYRVPLQPSLDGNTVDAQVERSEFAKNAIEYQASLTFLNSKINGLLKALRNE